MIGASDLLGTETGTDTKGHRSIFDIAGLVLVDEIGVHLHPRWKMRIIKALKSTFPKMSFIITTHEPLCLRGLVGGEVVLLQRDENNNVNIITDLPSPQTLSIQQLLTSSFFGMSSIMDPELEEKYDAYYALLAKAEKTEEEKEKLKNLQTSLKKMKLEVGNSITEGIEYQLMEEKVKLMEKKKRPV